MRRQLEAGRRHDARLRRQAVKRRISTILGLEPGTARRPWPDEGEADGGRADADATAGDEEAADGGTFAWKRAGGGGVGTLDTFDEEGEDEEEGDDDDDDDGGASGRAAARGEGEDGEEDGASAMSAGAAARDGAPTGRPRGSSGGSPGARPRGGSAGVTWAIFRQASALSERELETTASPMRCVRFAPQPNPTPDAEAPTPAERDRELEI